MSSHECYVKINVNVFLEHHLISNDNHLAIDSLVLFAFLKERSLESPISTQDSFCKIVSLCLFDTRELHVVLRCTLKTVLSVERPHEFRSRSRVRGTVVSVVTF